LMAGFRKRVAVEKWKCGFGWVIRSPSALDQYL